MTRVKICGLTSVADAAAAVEVGADAIGLNFWPRSPRCVDATIAREIVRELGERALMVGVFVDASEAEIRALQQQVGFKCVQLHGAEPPDLVTRFLPHAYKALRVRDAASIEDAARYPGDHVLLDAFVAGQPGGTGHTFNWQLAEALARKRLVTLAGGLHPGNVAQAVTAVRPFCVDVASGVESAPGVKDHAAMRAFTRAAKAVAEAPGLQTAAASNSGERSDS